MQVQTLVDRASALGRSLVHRPDRSMMPPELSGGLPVAGHTVEFVRSTIDLLTRAQREAGDLCTLRIANKTMVAVFGPEAHEVIFRATDAVMDPREAYKIMTPIFGEGMVYDAPPEKMNEQLKMILPALKDKRMRTYAQTVVKEVEQAIAGWGDEGEIDFVDFCRVLTNYTSANCLLGREFREEMTEEFAEIYHTLERGVTPLSYISHNLPLPSFRARDAARVRLVELIGGIIRSRRASGRTGEDFLQTLMDTKYSNGRPLNDDEITGMLLAAMFAGHHTSSVTTAWTMLDLLQHPSCRRTVVEEVDQLFGRGEEITFESLRTATEIEYSVLEALRLHPPLFMLVRVAKQDFPYRGYVIPEGTWVLISPTVSHRIPEVFEDASCFDPQRFAPERYGELHDYAYIPFGAGRHKCMGNAFALLQIKAIMAILLRDYEFSLGNDPIGSDFHGLVIGPSEPCRIRYRRRTDEPAPKKDKAKAAPKSAGKCPVAHAPSTAPFKVIVDTDLCQGHAVCMGEAPEVFLVGDDDKVELLRETPTAEYRQRVELAAKHCPTHSIRIEDLD